MHFYVSQQRILVRFPVYSGEFGSTCSCELGCSAWLPCENTRLESRAGAGLHAALQTRKEGKTATMDWEHSITCIHISEYYY